MRIWSIHPKYLDTKGLVALWRESLLAKNVLLGNTKGYKNHPQLERFKLEENPEYAIDYYLKFVWMEANIRAYHFNEDKFESSYTNPKIKVTNGQIDFERKHLLSKLKLRDKIRYDEIENITKLELHPIFTMVEGDIEYWEKH